MSQSEGATSSVNSHEVVPEVGERVQAKNNIEGLLSALDDADCRAMIAVTSEKALSAKEISDACDLPLSTTYRKLDLLTDTGLVEERTRICRSGKHVNEYNRLVDRVAISLGPHGEMELHVSQCEDAGQAGSTVSLIGE